MDRHVRGARKDAGVLAGHFQGSAREIDAFQAIRRRILRPTGEDQMATTKPGQGECRPIPWIACDRRFNERERFRDLPQRR